jgi:hypothetical protein
VMAESAGQPVFECLTARHREACQKPAAIQRHGARDRQRPLWWHRAAIGSPSCDLEWCSEAAWVRCDHSSAPSDARAWGQLVFVAKLASSVYTLPLLRQATPTAPRGVSARGHISPRLAARLSYSRRTFAAGCVYTRATVGNTQAVILRLGNELAVRWCYTCASPSVQNSAEVWQWQR